MNFYDRLEQIEESIEWVSSQKAKDNMYWMLDQLRELKSELVEVIDKGSLLIIQEQKDEIKRLRDSQEVLVNKLLGLDEVIGNENNL